LSARQRNSYWRISIPNGMD